jgi:hypothetical protein
MDPCALSAKFCHIMETPKTYYCQIVAPKDAIDIYLNALPAQYLITNVSRPSDTQTLFFVHNATSATMSQLSQDAWGLSRNFKANWKSV